MIHLTPADRVEAILGEGLRCGMPPELTDDAAWTLLHYEANPVFLARPEAAFVTALREGPWRDHAAFAVDVRGLPLAADLASLADLGARYDPEGYLFWRRRDLPAALAPYADGDCALEIEFLLDPHTDMCRSAIALTGTAACLADIPAGRLRLLPGPAVADLPRIG